GQAPDLGEPASRRRRTLARIWRVAAAGRLWSGWRRGRAGSPPGARDRGRLRWVTPGQERIGRSGRRSARGFQRVQPHVEPRARPNPLRIHADRGLRGIHRAKSRLRIRAYVETGTRLPLLLHGSVGMKLVAEAVPFAAP